MYWLTIYLLCVAGGYWGAKKCLPQFMEDNPKYAQIITEGKMEKKLIWTIALVPIVNLFAILGGIAKYINEKSEY